MQIIVDEPDPAEDLGFEIVINGSQEDQWARAALIEQDGKPTIGVFFDEDSFQDRLNQEGDSFTVVIPATDVEEDITGFLDGATVKLMEEKQAVLEIQTKLATYTIPAEQIQIDAISEAFGTDVNLQDIVIGIEIAAPTEEMVRIAENAANEGEFAIVVPPLEFSVKAAYGGAVQEIHSYTAYVERMIAVPDNVDPEKITTAVVVEPDGSLRHVPTKVVVIDGTYYAKVNSLTDSTYVTIWNPVEFDDVARHWARDSVNNMGSRMVVHGIGNGKFNPDDDITRAEFAAIVVRGLGLKLENGESVFPDVNADDWYHGAVRAAYEHQLISGFEDGTFRPNEKITREQALVMIANAMKITGLHHQLQERSAAETVQSFQDAGQVSSWALESAANAIQAGIVSGRSRTELAPQAFITRAEVAAIVERLLQKSGLI